MIIVDNIFQMAGRQAGRQVPSLAILLAVLALHGYAGIHVGKA